MGVALAGLIALPNLIWQVQHGYPTLEFMGHMRADVAGVPCQVFRLSFTGELSYELHHPVEQSLKLWRALMTLGADLGIRPHGLETLLRLRLEKGHIIVGQDSDFDATPRRLQHEWMVNLEKPEFLGRQALLRTNEIPLDKQLVGLEMASPAPPEGAIIWSGGDYAGYVTSSAYSPLLDARREEAPDSYVLDYVMDGE